MRGSIARLPDGRPDHHECAATRPSPALASGDTDRVSQRLGGLGALPTCLGAADAIGAAKS